MRPRRGGTGLGALATALLYHQTALAAISSGVVTSTDDLARPNATAEINIQGFDIRRTYPGTPIDGWKLSVNVASVPDNGAFVSVTDITYTAPPQLLQQLNSTNGTVAVATDRSWYICQHFLNATKLATIDASVNPDCSGLLPDKCITDLKASLGSGFGIRDEIYQCANPLPLPESCQSTFGTTSSVSNRKFACSLPPMHTDGCLGCPSLIAALSSPSFYLLSSLFDYIANLPSAVEDNLETFNGSSAYRLVGAPHSASNFTTYDAAISRIWIIGTVWASGNSTTLHASTPVASLNCLRAGNVAAGSRVPEKSAASTRTGSMVLLMVVLPGLAVTML
jgi:hypothetical protein